MSQGQTRISLSTVPQPRSLLTTEARLLSLPPSSRTRATEGTVRGSPAASTALWESPKAPCSSFIRPSPRRSATALSLGQNPEEPQVRPPSNAHSLGGPHFLPSRPSSQGPQLPPRALQGARPPPSWVLPGAPALFLHLSPTRASQTTSSFLPAPSTPCAGASSRALWATALSSTPPLRPCKSRPVLTGCASNPQRARDMLMLGTCHEAPTGDTGCRG